MAYHFYVYYRVRPEARDTARALVARLQLDLARATGVEGRTVIRTDEPELWMEIYENVVERGPFEATLARAGAETGLAEHLIRGSGRTVECFRD